MPIPEAATRYNWIAVACAEHAVVYVPAHEAPIAPLLDALEFVEDRTRWGWTLRRYRHKCCCFDSCLRKYHGG